MLIIPLSNGADGVGESTKVFRDQGKPALHLSFRSSTDISLEM